jgi:ribosomal protein S18 acetylase RimI-like enzyme
VIFDSLPEAFAKKLPRYPEVPAALVVRLAVDLQHRNKCLGETLLLDAMRRTLQSGLAAAVLVVDPKDEQAARFCYRYGFLDIGPGRARLYMPVTEIEKTLS